jgi:hypothetical protein
MIKRLITTNRVILSCCRFYTHVAVFPDAPLAENPILCLLNSTRHSPILSPVIITIIIIIIIIRIRINT